MDAFRYTAGELTDAARAVLPGDARATWAGSVAMLSGIIPPTNEIHRQPDGSRLPVPQTSSTSIGAYLWAIVAAEAIGFIDLSRAADQAQRTVVNLATLDRYQGFHDRTPFVRRSEWDESARSSSP